MNKLPHFSLRVYLALSYTMLVLVGLVSVGLYWFTEQEVAAEGALLTQLKEQARLFSVIPEILGQPDVALDLPGPLTAFSANLKAVYITPDLQMQRVSDLEMDENEKAIVLEIAPTVLSGQSVARNIHLAGSPEDEILYAASPVYDPNNRVSGAVCLILSLSDFRATMANLRVELLLFAGVLGFLSLLLGVFLAGIFTRPLAQAGSMSTRIASGDYSARIARKGPRELVELAQNFNHMAEELESQSKLRIQVLANITHELARPLGALRLGVDSLRKGAIDDQEFAIDLLKDMSDTLQNMEALLDDMSIAAQPTHSPLPLDLQRVDVKEYLRTIYSRFKSRADNRNLRFILDLPEEALLICADEYRLNQIFGNLIDNSLKFSPPGGRIHLSASRVDPWVEISIEDTGPGIPPDQISEIFTPFMRGRNVNDTSAGMGLGLSIVKQLVDAHQGQVELVNLPSADRRIPSGLLCVVRLPVWGPDSACDSLITENKPSLTHN